MKKKESYFRIGTRYYKILVRPTVSGDKVSSLELWNKDTIIADYGKDYISTIPKLDGFCCIPDHLNYSQIVDGFYNTYHEFPYPIPKETSFSLEELETQIPYTLEFMKHIFGEQYELGLDYIKIILERPAQPLPILCLVSKERATGKSTFIKWLRMIFGLNMTYIKGDSFSSQFNADWASKTLVAIDEVFFDSKEITERLKYLSTTNKDKVEAKGKDRFEIDFYVKFILCSNNEYSFLRIDEEENRFWVRKIKSIKNEDSNYIEKLQKEIPQFLALLLKRNYSVPKETRMWFTAQQIRTKALERLMCRQSNLLERRIVESLHELFVELDLNSVNVCAKDFEYISSKRRQQFCFASEIRKILKKWGFKAQLNSVSYTNYIQSSSNGEYTEITRVGRYYTIDRNFILKKFDELMKE